jgi:hypothetical protein
MSYDMWLGDYPEPDYPEPTDEDYCQMSGHAAYHDDPETGWRYCYCGNGCIPLLDEPHDEYSSYCADLIETYVSRLVALRDARPYTNVSDAMPFETRKTLRHKTPEYLLRLIASLECSKAQLSTRDWPSLLEDELDAFALLGLHLDLDGVLVLRSVLHRLNGDERFTASEFNTHLITPFHVMHDEARTALLRCSFLFYSQLAPDGHGISWRSTAIDLLCSVRPMLEKRPDLIKSMASLYNRHGYGSEVTERVMAMMDSEPVHETLVDGFL